MIQACYAPSYFAHTHTNSMEKLTAVAHELEKQQLAQLIAPPPLDIELLYQLHAPEYVEAFLHGTKPLAEMSRFKWSKQLRDAILAVNAGQLFAAELAFEQGISANVAQGFHHAHYEYGGGYCTFNGLALIAQQYPNKKILVLDCDQHGGDGTAEFTLRLPNLYNFTIFGQRYGCREHERSISRFIHPITGDVQQYMGALEEAFRWIRQIQPDLILYQAGMDCHHDDPYGSQWLDADMLYQRDLQVFRFAKTQGIPLIFVLAGGYQHLSRLVALHTASFAAAQAIYYPEFSSESAL